MQTGASVPEAIDNAYFGAAFNMVLLGFGSALSGYIDDVIGKMCFERGTNVVLETGQAVAIDQVHIGDYVKTIPESRNTAQDHEIVDAGDWRIIELTVETEGCDAVAITLLRPETWISAHGLRHDKHKFLMLPDAGVVGMARIEGVHLCPEPLHVSDGLVTGTFVTENATVLDLYVDSSTRPIGATATHPFYSVDQQRWVTAGRLAVGERIGTADGVATTLALIPRTDRQTVYNLEVHGSHTFFVGESQLWAHNVCDLIKVYSARVLNRAAEAADSYHNFPMTFDDAIIANGEHVLNGTYLKVTLEGTINGQTGTYELGGQMVGNIFRITHRFFNPG